MLDIVDAREPHEKEVEEVLLGRGEGLARENAEEVAKIVPAACQLTARDQIAGEQGTHEWNETHLTLGKSTRPEVTSSSPKYSTSIPSSSFRLKSIPEFLSSSILSGAYMSSLPSAPLKLGDIREVELEVELPRHAFWAIAILIAQRHAQLDNLEHVDITPHRLVVVV